MFCLRLQNIPQLPRFPSCNSLTRSLSRLSHMPARARTRPGKPRERDAGPGRRTEDGYKMPSLDVSLYLGLVR